MTFVPTLRHLRIPLLLAAFMLLSGSVPTAEAQPVLNFKRVINNWPTIELYFSISCNGEPAYFTDKRYFKVFEDGIEIGEFELWCPDPKSRCAISVALVFDASGSMSGPGTAGAKAAGLAFIDLMDGVQDEAAIIWFTSTVTVAQQMTVYKDLLTNAVNGLPASGATAVWDGAYTGVMNLINDGVNPCRAVIVMTDGGDNSSARTPAEIIALANRNRIRVFTIGLGSGIQSAILKNIADLTGGRYYETPNPAQLAAIYEEISTIIFQGFQECLITYIANCPDGAIRRVDLTVHSFCGGSDTKTKTYKAPKDTSVYQPIQIRLGKRVARGNQEVKVPLELLDPLTAFTPVLNTAIFQIQFDESCVQFRDIKTPKGSLLEGVPITISPTPGGVTFETMEKRIVDIQTVPAQLAELTFRTSDPEGRDTVCCPIKLTSWVFSAGCYKPVLIEGEICIIPRMPKVDCDIQMPQQINWERSLKDYNPNPFTVSMIVSNTGDREARNTKFKIDWKAKNGEANNKNDLVLVAPVSNVQAGVPKNVDPSGISEARWEVMAKRRMVGDSIIICITAAFDNHDSVKCCKAVWVPPADAVLSCVVTAPEIKADRVNQRYNPMPFTVDVLVTNEGGKATDSVFATIIVPPDLRLYGPDAPDKYTKRVLPAVLKPGGSGGASWTLWHPITLTSREYKVGVWAKTANADSSYCEVDIIIPPLEAPVLAPTCTTPKKLVFNEALDTYEPNPFSAALSCVNRGGLPASNVTGFIYLPADVELVDPGEPLRKAFPTPMNEWKVGDPVPSVSWNVRYTKKRRYDQILDFKFVVGGTGPTGLPTDSVEVWCRVEVPGLAPSFACDFTAPDSIALNASETDVEPNPFTVRYRVWNTSRLPANIVLMDVNYPLGEGLSLDASTPKTRAMNTTLNPGDTLTAEWIFHVQNRITRRMVDIYGIAYDDEGNPILSGPGGRCGKQIPIANLKTSLLCDLQTTEPVIRYIPILQEYEPTKWLLTCTLTNSGGFELTNVFAELELWDETGTGPDSTYAYLQMFDPSFPDNSNPKGTPVLFTSTSRTFQWAFQLADRNLTGVPRTLMYNIRYGSKETPTVTGTCQVPVVIQPVVMPELTCEIAAPDTIWFVEDRYEPSPFDMYVKVNNIGTGIAYNVRAYILQDTRFNIMSATSRDYGDVDPKTSIDFYDPLMNGPFSLRVNPRADDGYDTIRVVVVADGIPATSCYFPVYVKREQRPVFEMACQAIPDRLVFDDQLNDYVPNPFDVITTAVNIGDTRAENCQLVFVGPPRFTPADQTSIVSVGTGGVMEVRDTVRFNWKLVPLRRSIGGWDTLIYQIQGRGGLGKRLVIGECKVPIYVPPARAAEYKVVCSAPISLTFDNSSGQYVPDPFEFKAVVTNEGKALGQGLEITASLPDGLIFASGESPTKVIGDLNVNDFVEITWLVKPIAVLDGIAKTRTICARVADKLANESSCCSDVIVPPATKATLSLTCDAVPDVMVVDRQRGEYETNPITVFARITNNGDRPADNVRLVCLPQSQSNELRVLGDPERLVALRLDPKQTTDTISWLVYAVPRTQTGYIDIQFVVTADQLPSTQCIKPVLVPEVGRPALDCNGIVSSMSGDFLKFDYSIGDYRDDYGTRGATGEYNVFTITAEIRNVGAAQASRVVATLLPPEGVMFDVGESSKKELGNILIGSNNFAKVSWNVRPIRESQTQEREFAVVVTSDNTPQYKCFHKVTVEGAPKIVHVRLPNNPVGRFGDKIIVPVYVDTTIGKDIYQYKLNVRFDPKLVRFVDVASVNTLTARGWSGPRATAYREKGSAEENVVRFEDYTTGSPLNVRGEGILTALTFEAVYNDEGSLGAQSGPLEFLQSFTSEIEGRDKVFVSSMNSNKDNDPGKDISLDLENGMVTVSGECVVPLVGSGKFQLSQNKPNPFNPSTIIEYEIGRETEVRLTVFDALGREVAVLVNTRQAAGRYAVIFDASQLPSGTYSYRLDTPQYNKTLRMVLAR